MPDRELKASQALSHLILIRALWHRDYAPCFMRKRRVREVKASCKVSELASGRTGIQLQVIQS